MQDNKEKFMKAVCKIIKNRRKKLGKSIYQISAESDIQNSTWRKAESGIYKDIQFITLWKMLEGLEFPPDEFVAELKENLGCDFSLADN